MNASAALTVRSVEEADWPALELINATCFGRWPSSETGEMFRTMTPAGGIVVACDGPDIVGMAWSLDLRLTVPGGAVLPMAGMTGVAVSPTHRRRGALRAMFAELDGRLKVYPIAGLSASDAGIYGRFGYGPATTLHRVAVDRREARFHADVLDPGGVRIVRVAERREQLAEIYERWRLQTPGGLHSPPQMWDDVLRDPEEERDGGSAFFCLLHADGFAMYRVHGDAESKRLDVTKLVAVTLQSRIALFRVLLGVDLIDTVTVKTHPGDILPYLLTDPRLVRTTGVEDGLWLRLNDVVTALEARTYAANLSVVLDISDDAFGGGGKFALEVSDGRARCVASQAPADVQTTLGVLGSLYLGEHPASAFAAANRLRCANSETVTRLDAAFATDVPAEAGYEF